MATIVPGNENIKRAVAWISAEVQRRGEEQRKQIVNEATLRFDLSPKDSEFILANFAELIQK